MKTFRILIAVIAIALSPVSLAEKWQLATPYPQHNFHTENISWFGNEIARVSDGRLEIKIHPNGGLYRHPDIWDAVSNGQVQAGEVLISSRLSEDKIYSIDAVPFLASSYQKADKLYRVSRQFFEERLHKQGLILLYSVPWPPQGMYLRDPIRTIDDLRDRRFRTYNASTSELATLLGGVAALIEYSDLTEALNGGKMDAMFTSSTGGVEVEAWKYFGYFYDLQAWLPRNMVVVNRNAFEQLPPDLQKQVLEVANQAEKRGIERSEELHRFHIQVLEEHGLEVISPEPLLMEGFQMVGSALVSRWIKQAGQDGAELIADYVR